MGRYIVGTGKRNRQLKEMEAKQKEIEMLVKQTPVVNQITPVAQAIEIAKSEIERERKKEAVSSVRRLKLIRYQQSD